MSHKLCHLCVYLLILCWEVLRYSKYHFVKCVVSSLLKKSFWKSLILTKVETIFYMHSFFFVHCLKRFNVWNWTVIRTGLDPFISRINSMGSLDLGLKLVEIQIPQVKSMNHAAWFMWGKPLIFQLPVQLQSRAKLKCIILRENSANQKVLHAFPYSPPMYTYCTLLEF